MRGFLFGMCLGAIAGIMYAPATGSRTRTLLRDQYAKYRTELPELVDTQKRELSTRVEGVKQNMMEMRTRLEDKYGPVMDKMIDAREDMKNRVDEMRGMVEEKVGELRRSKTDETRIEGGEDQFRQSA